MWNYVSSSILFLLRAVSNCFPSALTHQILRILPYLFLGCVCYGFDAIFLKIQGEYAPYIGAVADNAAHGIIAFFSWCIVCEIHTRKHLIDGILCGIIACAIDLDHFIAAKSFKLKVRDTNQRAVLYPWLNMKRGVRVWDNHILCMEHWVIFCITFYHANNNLVFQFSPFILKNHAVKLPILIG